eukprot:CFRG5632T1
MFEYSSTIRCALYSRMQMSINSIKAQNRKNLSEDIVDGTHRTSFVNELGSLGADCTNSLLTALVPTTGECVSTSIGSVHAIMNGDTAEGSAYLTPDCSGAPIVSVATTDEDVCVNAGIASFKLYCMDA